MPAIAEPTFQGGLNGGTSAFQVDSRSKSDTIDGKGLVWKGENARHGVESGFRYELEAGSNKSQQFPLVKNGHPVRLLFSELDNEHSTIEVMFVYRKKQGGDQYCVIKPLHDFKMGKSSHYITADIPVDEILPEGVSDLRAVTLLLTNKGRVVFSAFELPTEHPLPKPKVILSPGDYHLIRLRP
jgi:hypothetical protein